MLLSVDGASGDGDSDVHSVVGSDADNGLASDIAELDSADRSQLVAVGS